MPSYSAIDLDERRMQGGSPVQPFPHQKEAFQALDRVFSLDDRSSKAALLVLPTGAGKTFTSVNWACRRSIPRGMQVLWLAQSFHLLDQALESFNENARHIPPDAKYLNVRVVSSHPSHDTISAIRPTDNVVIVTTQTAIAALNVETLALDGRTFVSNLETFIRDAARTGLLVILDEAHHAPAYGCRRLLAKIRELVPHMSLLGLTATPTYTDEAKRGWLGKIFTDGVAYQAKQANLMAQNILAKPVFREMPTGLELEVDNELYRRLVQEHKDLPDAMVEKLARNSARNDYIVKHYADNAATYGKTLIFADRWFQCVYIAQKLKDRKIRAAAVFSHVDGTRAGDALAPSSTTVENAENIRRFKSNEIDVLVNVRMLTEGTDVPDIRSVFVTRQTTSSILLTQMVGRALRGKRAGGGDDKEQANIVLFVDKWKHLLDIWAAPDLKGGTEATKPVRGHLPMDFIAIHLVEALAQRINNPEAPVDNDPFLDHIPVGWYRTDHSVSVSEDGKETMEPVREFVMVFEHAKDNYARFVEAVFTDLPEAWGKESLTAEWTEPQVQTWVTKFFADDAGDLGRALTRNLTSIARHMGVNGSRPEFVPFAARDQFDLDRLAEDLYNQPSPNQLEALRAEFDRDGNLWRVFYKSSFDWFKMDFDAAIYRIWRRQTQGAVGPPSGARTAPPRRTTVSAEELSKLRQQVLQRDNGTCQACGAAGQGVKLELDHIVSRDHGGGDAIDNLQILCSICNSLRFKGVNDINFRLHSTPLKSPKPGRFLGANAGENVERSLRRLVNFFYHCGAVCMIKTSQKRNGKNYGTWEIELYASNDPRWLEEHKVALLEHIAADLGAPHVTDIVIR
jgi:superfamily II DNA or RNA helicase